MKKKSISIGDVAREMGVSVTTVSFVLNDKFEGRVSPKLARRILAYADRVGYRPNVRSRRKTRGHPKLYGVLVEDIRNPFQRDLVFHLQQNLNKRGADALIMSMNGDYTRAFSLAKSLGTLDLSGYFFMSVNLEEDVKWDALWRGPIVLWGAQWGSAYSVRPDYTALLQPLLLDTIDRLALERVALVCCSSDPFTANSFVSAYMDAMDRLERDVVVKKIPYNLNDSVVQAQLADFMRDNKQDALVFSSNRLAHLAMRSLAEVEGNKTRCIVSPSYVSLGSGVDIQQVVMPLDASYWADAIVSQLAL